MSDVPSPDAERFATDQLQARNRVLAGEVERLTQLLACKDEALGVFASNRMWGPVDLLGVFQWIGAGLYENPVTFARREMMREEPNDSIGSVTHTME